MLFLNPYSFDNNFGPPGFDPAFESTVFLANFIGSDAATSYSDESFANKGALNFLDNAQLDTDEFPFSTSSLLLDGTGDFVSAAADNDFVPSASEEYTWEAWAYAAAAVSGASEDVFTYYNPGSNERAWLMTRVASTGLFRFVYSLNGVATTTIDSDSDIVDSVWTHLAVARDAAGVIRLFMDGVTQTNTATETGAFHQSTTGLRVGARVSAGNPWNGWIGPVRLTKGLCRYDTDFIPPTDLFPIVGP